MTNEKNQSHQTTWRKKTLETPKPKFYSCEAFIEGKKANLGQIREYLKNNSKAGIRLNEKFLWISQIDQNGNAKASFTDQLHSNSQGKGWQEVDIQITEKDGKIW